MLYTLDSLAKLDTNTHESDTETREAVEHEVERTLRSAWSIRYNPGGLPFNVKPGLAHRSKPDFNSSADMFGADMRGQICAKPGFSVVRLYGLHSSVQMSCWAWDLARLGWIHCGEAYLSEGPVLRRYDFDLATVGCIYTVIHEPLAVGHLAKQPRVQSSVPPHGQPTQLERYWAVYLEYTPR